MEMERRGLATENAVFGMGGGLLQHCNRDTMEFGMKANAVRVNGEWRDISKSPTGDSMKHSKAGRLALQYSDGDYRTVARATRSRPRRTSCSRYSATVSCSRSGTSRSCRPTARRTCRSTTTRPLSGRWLSPSSAEQRRWPSSPGPVAGWSFGPSLGRLPRVTACAPAVTRLGRPDRQLTPPNAPANPENLMSKLHIFDMDGTLLHGSACLDISRHMGHTEAVTEMEERWSAGGVGHVEFYEFLLPLWTGLTVKDVDDVFEATDWLDGVEEVWRDIARRGEHSAVITLSPQFFADRLLPWGLGSAHGAGVLAGEEPDPALVMTPESKLRVARELMEHHGVSEEDCVAYGDSASDIPLFRDLKNTVAVNGTDSLREVAAASYEGDDLRGAYEAGRRLLERSGADRQHDCVR